MIAVLMFSMAQAPAVDLDQPMAEVDGWSIYRNSLDKTCHAISLYENGEGVIVFYDAAHKDSKVAFTEKNATSLKDDEERTINVYLQKNTGKIDDGWEDVKFTAHITEQGRPMLFSQSLLPPFLDDFAKSRSLAFFYGTKKIAAYKLGKSADVAKALRKCAMKEAGINPLDPFAN